MVNINPNKKIVPALSGQRSSPRLNAHHGKLQSTSYTALSTLTKNHRHRRALDDHDHRFQQRKDARSAFNPNVAVAKRKSMASYTRRRKMAAVSTYIELRKRKSTLHRKLIDMHRRRSQILAAMSRSETDYKGIEYVFYKKTPIGCLKKTWDSLGDLSAEEDSDAVDGRWDFWRPYYCNRPHIETVTQINPYYLAWAILYTVGIAVCILLVLNFFSKYQPDLPTVGQNTHMTLIQLTFENGGVAFLVVCFVVYIGLGYPLYVLETMIGQYGGRKTLAMLRFMAPYMQGIGPALWLRTFFIGIECMTTAIFGFHYFLDLYVCIINDNSLLRGFWYSMNTSSVLLGGGTVDSIDTDTSEKGFFLNSYRIEWVIISITVTFVLVLMKLRTFGHLYDLVWKGAFLVWVGYLILAILRTTTQAESSSIMYFPLYRVIRTDWTRIWSPKVWMDAVLYVITSLGLATLVHPYFGSRSFYHYRAPRDGIIITLLTIIWNLVGATSTLLFLGYLTMNRKEICSALKNIGGFYGLFVTYPMKHIQAHLMQDLVFLPINSSQSMPVCPPPNADELSDAFFNVVEYDIQFYCSLYFGMVALVGLCAFHCCVGALISCSFQEFTTTLMAITIGLILALAYALITPLLFVTPYGLTLLLAIEFYTHKTFTVIFVSGCFFWGVAYSHNLGKLMYDFRNILHLTTFEPKDEQGALKTRFAIVFRHVVLIFFILMATYLLFQDPVPVAGGVVFPDEVIICGLVLTALPLVYIVFVYVLVCCQGIYGSKYRQTHFTPHRDWYKNWFHIVVCFTLSPLRRDNEA